MKAWLLPLTLAVAGCLGRPGFENVEPDLSHFSGIVPCGVSDNRYGVTSLVDLGNTVTMDEVDAVMRREFGDLFSDNPHLKA